MTRQIGDLILLPDGTRSSYWPGIPMQDDHPRIRNASANTGTHCHRGWSADWRIFEGWLWLVNSHGLWEYTGEPLLATWVTGHFDLLRSDSYQVVSDTTQRFQKRHSLDVEAGQVLAYERYIWDAVEGIRRSWIRPSPSGK